jgi:hypothetical protein
MQDPGSSIGTRPCRTTPPILSTLWRPGKAVSNPERFILLKKSFECDVEVAMRDTFHDILQGEKKQIYIHGTYVQNVIESMPVII